MNPSSSSVPPSPQPWGQAHVGHWLRLALERFDARVVDLVARNPGRWQVEALTANSDAQGLAEAARACGAKFAVVGDPSAYAVLKSALAGSGIEAAAGAEAICEAARRPGDIVLTAIVGAAGLAPTLAAVERGATLAIAKADAIADGGTQVQTMGGRVPSAIMSIIIS